ncbi:hypothetical protein RvY_07613 [Ramazzottius varieornatus]|uniref:Uncharacterized protein n=1 Tax=Ramazzottius varieornatus TaxID=947166 RepID=A0A1D1V2U3_RAMVA|nr:hypothetical protein RvY_07613 [Ramazzottius varieornatus]
MSIRPQHAPGPRSISPRGGYHQQNTLQRFSSNPIPQYATGANSQPLAPLRHPMPSALGTVPDAASTSNSAGDSDQPGGKVPFEWRQDLDAKRLRKSIYRRTVDYFTPIVKYVEERSVYVEPTNFRALLADPLYVSEMLSPVAYPHNTASAITTKFIRQATNKVKCPVFVALWTPDGRRLVTGSSSGEFTLWNGLTFNFETILQAHEGPVRSMVWSRSDTWLVTGDANGHIKYWQTNMNNVKSFQAHRDSIRGITFCPTDFKFATGSDDGTIRIWDFDTCETIKVLKGGHGGEVKCVDWHPKKSLLVTGSRDNQQPVKLWDPRTAEAIGTLYLHKGPVTDLKWNPINSNYLASSSRDTLVKLFDLRTMKDFQTCRGHKREVMSLGWHPIYQSLFCTGGIDGSLMFWNIGTEQEVGAVENAHDGSIWSMSWHPQGHILVTGSNDCSVKFWTRNRPGDPMKDKYNAKARSETDNPLDLKKSEMEYEYEEEEEEQHTTDVHRGQLDMQDVSEFENNAPRSFRPMEPPAAPFIPPQQPQHFGPRGGPEGSFRPGGPGPGYHAPPRGYDEQSHRFPPPNNQGSDQGYGNQDRRNESFQRYSDRGVHRRRSQDRDQHWDQRNGGGNRRFWNTRNRQDDNHSDDWNQSQSDSQQPQKNWDDNASEYGQSSATTDSQSAAGRPEGGLLPPPSEQGLSQTQNDYRRGDKRPWEAPHTEENRYQYQDRNEGSSSGQTGYSNRGAYHEGNREYRPRGDRSRGGRRGGQWRGAR